MNSLIPLLVEASTYIVRGESSISIAIGIGPQDSRGVPYHILCRGCDGTVTTFRTWHTQPLGPCNTIIIGRKGNEITGGAEQRRQQHLTSDSATKASLVGFCRLYYYFRK
ncbi:ALI_HP2_G0056370.mRNA.1.CDS.1 [Saccharomyces cerevisiae]|nr:ALI_HP2_G0056370.mRNA.1.CDS.1 [Saccharomyces cerevisiae]CAI6829036.1 ALI_HP2_G0056370.mRNA.1.CDS.1 [Saccharomyces cerevisiae]CAI6837981.1 ALI_HP1_G0057110.mRNA.1.CDS.1 [Saccharomyces cerevisiae]CAI6921867.1 ALI_collapsed_G0058750.mRNA.1.CDS.1 [Saccharomyces cerevisiae]